jgi:hypothetical protein
LNSKDGLQNFVQGKLWRDKRKLFAPEEIVLPYILYYDDFETGNALGSHAGSQSIAGFFFFFPTLPSGDLNLNNILVAQLMKTNYLKRFGSNLSLSYLIDSLKEIESAGILINIENNPKCVKFVLGLVIGDNLALNSIMGFSSSFSHNYYCRFCKVDKSVLQYSCTENVRRKDYS